MHREEHSRHAYLSSRTLSCYTSDCVGQWQCCWSVFTRITPQRQPNCCPFSQQGPLSFLTAITLNWLSKANSNMAWKLEAEKHLSFFVGSGDLVVSFMQAVKGHSLALSAVNELCTDCPARLLRVVLNERERKLLLLADWSWLTPKQVD